MTVKQPLVALYSSYVGTRSHATSCTVPTCMRLAQRGRFRPILITGSSFSPGEQPRDYELVPIEVDFSFHDASQFLCFGPFSQPIRGIFRIIQSWRHLRGLRHWLASRSDVALVHFFDYEYFTLSRFLQRHLPNDVRVVVTIFQSDFARSELSWRTLYKRLIYANFRSALLKAHGIIVYGDFIKARLIHEMRFSEEESRRIFVARYHSGDAEPGIDKLTARQKLGIADKQRVVLVFGVIRDDKRVDMIIKACAHAKSEPFLIIAGAPWTLSEHDVHKWIKNNRLEDRVLAHLRWIDDADIATYYAAADLFISAYDQGYVGQSGPLNICRAFRLPAVVSDTGELGYYVQTTGVGLLARAGDYHSFAARIDEYFASESLRHQLLAALDQAAIAYSWDYFVDQIEACYQHVLMG